MRMRYAVWLNQYLCKIEKLVEILQQQIAVQERRQDEQLKEQVHCHEEQTKVLQEMIGNCPPNPEHEMVTAPSQVATLNFVTFDPTSELWPDYWSRFCTFTNAHSVSNSKKPKASHTSQNFCLQDAFHPASQETLPKDLNELVVDQIAEFMKRQFNPKHFIVWERFHFGEWHEVKTRWVDSGVSHSHSPGNC